MSDFSYEDEEFIEGLSYIRSNSVDRYIEDLEQMLIEARKEIKKLKMEISDITMDSIKHSEAMNIQFLNILLRSDNPKKLCRDAIMAPVALECKESGI